MQQRLGKSNPTAPFAKRRLRLTCSLSTIRAEFRRDGQKYGLRVRKTIFTKVQRQERYKWGKSLPRGWHRRVHCWIDQWFVRIPLNHTVPRSAKCWRRDRDKYSNWATRPNPHYKAPGAKVLAGFAGANGPGHPAKVLFCARYDRMNEKTVTSIYRRFLMPALRRHYPGRTRFQIQQDGDRSQNARGLLALLGEWGVSVFGANSVRKPPARSGDLWPCETMWALNKGRVTKRALLKRKWREGVGTNATAADLRAWEGVVVRVVRSTPSPFLQRLVSGMPGRILELLQKKGGPISK